MKLFVVLNSILIQYLNSCNTIRYCVFNLFRRSIRQSVVLVKFSLCVVCSVYVDKISQTNLSFLSVTIINQSINQVHCRQHYAVKDIQNLNILVL